jgi:NaMN:DMB phosphoribosyltransferase
MAVTVTHISTPNAGQTWGSLGTFDTLMVDVLMDSSYLTTGEPITAAQFGLTGVVGAIPLSMLTNRASSNTSGMPVHVFPNAAQTQLTIQPYRYDGASAGKAFMEEVANAVDVSAYTVRLLVIGF